jgi:hypothetical protein
MDQVELVRSVRVLLEPTPKERGSLGERELQV